MTDIPSLPSLLFLQRRTGRAGAQSALWRLVEALVDAGRSVVVVVHEEGWLVGALRSIGADVLVEPFPKPRSLGARLWATRMWAGRVATRLKLRGIEATGVIGNDHQESLPARALARRLGVPSAVILRSSGMSERDFAKYRCADHAVCFALGADLAARAARFPGGEGVRPLVDGLAAGDFVDHRPLPTTLPDCALVVGTPHPDKGWGDFAAALAMLPPESPLHAMRFDFTGEPSEDEARALGLATIPPALFRFLPRTPRFADLLAGYDLVIHPSRRETFGLAALEAIAAGVPVISTRVGALPTVLPDAALFAPADPSDMAGVLRDLPTTWPHLAATLPAVRAQLRTEFGIDRAAHLFLEGVGPHLAR